MKMIDKAKLSIAGNKAKGWCKFVEERDSQREGKTFYDCQHEEAKKRLISGGDEPCTSEDWKRCPFRRIK